MNLEKFRNKLIVLEGGDACGKTTVAKMLVDYLNKNNIPTIFTFQPGDPNYGLHGQLFRSMCKDKRWNLHALTNFFIFFADKVEQADKIIEPALKAGKTVVSDRWWHSTYAYQFCGKQIVKKYNMPEVVGMWLNKFSVLGLDPDVVFYFHQQIEKHNREEYKNDLFDAAAEEFKKRVHDGYEALAELPNVRRVDKGDSAEETLQNLLLIDF